MSKNQKEKMSGVSSLLHGALKALMPEKSSPPKPLFCIDSNKGVVSSLFQIRPSLFSTWKEDFVLELEIGNNLFGSVSENGYLCVWDFHFRRVAWGMETNVNNVQWADMLPNDSGSPTGLIQSKDTGLHWFRSDKILNSQVKMEKFDCSNYNGFCKSVVTTSGKLYYATEKNGICCISEKTLSSNDNNSPVCQQRETTEAITFLHPFRDKNNEYVIVGCDGGLLRVLEFNDAGSNNDSSIRLTSYKSIVTRTEDTLVPLCCAGDECSLYFAVGTTSTELFLLSWNSELKSLDVLGAKSIVNRGIGCLALRPDKKLLAAGCWDGKVRLFTFPGMMQLLSLDFHKAPITSLLFLDKIDDWTGKDQYYLICGARDHRLTGWDLFNQKWITSSNNFHRNEA